MIEQSDFMPGNRALETKILIARYFKNLGYKCRAQLINAKCPAL